MWNWVILSGSWKKKTNIEAESMLCISPRLSIVKRGFLIKRQMTHWRNIKMNKNSLISIFNSFLNWYSCLNISLRMFKYICFEFFLLMIKISKSVLLLQKINRLFPRNNRLFCVWQHYEEMDLISFLISGCCRSQLWKNPWSMKQCWKLITFWKKLQHVIKEYIPKSWKLKSFYD